MLENPPIERVKELLVADNKWLALYFDEVRLPDGRLGNYNRLVEKGGDGVAILPINKDREFGLIRIFRYPISKYLWEVPRGFGEGISIQEEASRELREETGFKAGSMRFLGTVYPNTGISSTAVNLFLAEDLEQVKAEDKGYEAIEEFMFFDYDTVVSMIDNGEIADCISLSVIFSAQRMFYSSPT